VADILRGMPYSGSLVGFFIFSFIADNYGRRLGIGASWFCASIGALVLGVYFINISFIVKLKLRDGGYRNVLNRVWG
jgi:OCT family organic cation transporter-like MFS transporter 4/5